jgi:uncharacterized protein
MKHLGRVLLAVLALFSSAEGLDLNSLKPQGYLSDFAGVVDPASRQKIELYAARLEKATGAQMAIVTLQTLDGEPIEEVANDLFRRWGIGKKGEDNGLLFLLVIQDRRSRLETGFGLEPIINAGQAGSLLRSMRPALRQNQYGEALWVAATAMGDKIAAAKGVQVDMGAPRPRHAPEPASGDIPWPLIIGGIFLLLMIMGKGNRRGGGGGGGFLPGLILGSMMGGRSSYGGYGGGGFGGYDSGDTFGGFGGGDSGGGGASSDW